jgi:hypothetical protein
MAVDGRLVPGEEFLEGLRVAPRDPDDQFLVGRRWGHVPIPFFQAHRYR